ncbi:unnamed protein product [Soboliphyme baturini]|uniref:Uncharacterized protein n=1 Tax=Soboliphyme baturini TaxID=241478 RepID=A0A183IPA2_9BILA|nr:unnamed protein product [Soboliphyme baturini]
MSEATDSQATLLRHQLKPEHVPEQRQVQDQCFTDQKKLSGNQLSMRYTPKQVGTTCVLLCVLARIRTFLRFGDVFTHRRRCSTNAARLIAVLLNISKWGQHDDKTMHSFIKRNETSRNVEQRP